MYRKYQDHLANDAHELTHARQKIKHGLAEVSFLSRQRGKFKETFAKQGILIKPG